MKKIILVLVFGLMLGIGYTTFAEDEVVVEDPIVCLDTEELIDGVCVLIEVEAPICVEPQILVGDTCIDPEPTPDPEPLVCDSGYVLIGTIIALTIILSKVMNVSKK